MNTPSYHSHSTRMGPLEALPHASGQRCTCLPRVGRLQFVNSHRWLAAENDRLTSEVKFEDGHAFELRSRQLAVQISGGRRCVSRALTLQPCNDVRSSLLVDRISTRQIRIRTGASQDAFLADEREAGGTLLLMHVRRVTNNGSRCGVEDECGRPAVLNIVPSNVSAWPCSCSFVPPWPTQLPAAADARVEQWPDGAAAPYDGLDVYVLNLRSRSERYQRVERELRGAGVPRHRIHRVDATAAATLWSSAAGPARTVLEAVLATPSVPRLRLDAAALSSGAVARTLPRSRWRLPSAAEVATSLTHLRALSLAEARFKSHFETGSGAAKADRSQTRAAHAWRSNRSVAGFVGSAAGGSSAPPLALILEDDADVTTLARCWSKPATVRAAAPSAAAFASGASLGRSWRPPRLTSLHELARHDAKWEFVQLGALSPVAYRRLPAAAEGVGGVLLPRLAHSWGAVATIWSAHGARSVLRRLSAAASFAHAAHALSESEPATPVVPSAALVRSALEALSACGLVADSCLYVARLPEDDLVPAATHGYTASPPLILPVRPHAPRREAHAKVSVAAAAASTDSTASKDSSAAEDASSHASSIQTSQNAARDARELGAIWAWAWPLWCAASTTRQHRAMPLPPSTSARATRAVRLICSSPAAPGGSSWTCSEELSTLPKALCGMCSS